MKIKTKIRAGGTLPARDDGSSGGGGGRGCG